MSLREKTISGAKWSAIATVIIIGLGLVQMTVLARIIDNHQFGLLTVSLVIIALADTLSDFGIANSIIQRKEISHLELTTLYWLNVGLGLVVCVAVFLLSDLIGDVLNNPDLAPLIKTLSLAFVVIPHGQQFRALMQKELEFNKIGMIETSAVLAGFTFTVVSAHFWPLAMTAILGYLVNSAVRNAAVWLLWTQNLSPRSAFLAGVSCAELTLWCLADGGQHHQLSQHQPFNAGAGTYSRRGRGWGVQPGVQRGRCAADEAEPNHHPRVVSGICQNSGRHRKAARQLLQAAVGGGYYQLSGAAGADGGVE